MSERRAELEDRARARAELEWRRAEGDLGLFVEKANPGFARPKHLQPVLDVFDRIEQGESVFATVAAPPRHGKTVAILAGGVRALRRRRSARVLYTSHTAEIANEKSRDARDMALRSGLWLGRVDAKDRHDPARTVRFWQTSSGGAFMALGRGGRPIGRGFHLIIIDDPFGDIKDAESPKIRQQVWEWVEGTLMSRLEPGGSIVIAHQRWHKQDLIGRIKDKPASLVRWEHVSLPALGPAGPLWPEVWGQAELERKRAAVGDYVWASNYQQSPILRGAGVFHAPVTYGRWPPNLLGKRIGFGVDTGGTVKTSSNPSAIVGGVFTGRGDARTMDIFHAEAKRMEIPDLVKRVMDLQRTYPGAVFVIEINGLGLSVYQSVRRLAPKALWVPISSVTDKFTTAIPAAAAWNRGSIRTPIAAPWLAPYLEEVLGFTGMEGGVDDQTDATVRLWNWSEFGLARGRGAGETTTGLDGGGY